MLSLTLNLIDQFGAEIFSGTISDLIDWLNDPEQNDLNQILDLETWEEQNDAPVLVFKFNEREITTFDLEATRQFLCQLPIPRECIAPELLCQLMGEVDEDDAGEVEEINWN